jgi:hypothetical protein
VAKLLANVRAAFEHATALPRADVFGFDSIVHRPWCRMKRPLLALAALSFRSLALAGTASLVAAVTAAVQHRSTNAHALRRFILALVAERARRSAAASAFDDDGLLAASTVAGVADLLALVTAW